MQSHKHHEDDCIGLAEVKKDVVYLKEKDKDQNGKMDKIMGKLDNMTWLVIITLVSVIADVLFRK